MTVTREDWQRCPDCGASTVDEKDWGLLCYNCEWWSGGPQYLAYLKWLGKQDEEREMGFVLENVGGEKKEDHVIGWGHENGDKPTHSLDKEVAALRGDLEDVRAEMKRLEERNALLVWRDRELVKLLREAPSTLVEGYTSRYGEWRARVNKELERIAQGGTTV